jgi:ethylene receptor
MPSEAAKVLGPGSALATASGGGKLPAGGVDAIRVPILKVYIMHHHLLIHE